MTLHTLTTINAILLFVLLLLHVRRLRQRHWQASAADWIALYVSTLFLLVLVFCIHATRQP